MNEQMYVNVDQYGGGMVSLIALIYLHKQVQGAEAHGFSFVHFLVVDTRAQVFSYTHTPIQINNDKNTLL